MVKQIFSPISKEHEPKQVQTPFLATQKRGRANIQSLPPILQLQRKIGNRAVGRLLQTKLTISQPGDEYEQEADRVAEQIMRMSDTQLQRKCDCAGDTDPDGECVACKANHLRIQRQAHSKIQGDEDVQEGSDTVLAEASLDLEHHLSNSRGNGQALPEDTRSSMEAAFGADFSGVHVHTGNEAAKMNQELSAQAFTYGSDIYFNSGKYDTRTRDGKRLLAHELTHTIQQIHAETTAKAHHFSSDQSLMIQRQSRDQRQKAGDDPTLANELEQEVKEAEAGMGQDVNLMLRASASRRHLLLTKRVHPPLKKREDLDSFVAECDKLATTELDTLNAFSPAGAESALLGYPKGFPLTWSGRIRAALTLGVDPATILANYFTSLNDLTARSVALGPEIYAHGLPVPFSEPGLRRLDSFHLLPSDSKTKKPSAVRDYALESIRYIRLKWVTIFAFYWEKFGEEVATAVADGEIVPKYKNWKDFIDNKQANLRALPERASERLAQTDKEAQQIETEALNLRDAAFKLSDTAIQVGTASALYSIAGLLSGWIDASERFDAALKVADGLVERSSKGERLVAAIQWAIDNDYFGAAVLTWAQNLINQGPEILKEISLIVILGMIPGVNSAVAVYLLYTAARDVVGMLDELAAGLNDVMQANNVGQLQKAAAQLAQILTRGAITIMIVLATLGVGKAAARVRKRAAELRTANRALSAEAAEKKALEEMSAAERRPLEEAAQKVEEFDRRYTPETKPILDTPGVRAKLASISEDARSLIELCDSPCLPPAPQILKADLKLLERIQKRLGRPGYDRGLREYFYNRRKAPGGLQQAIEDLEGVKKADLQKFLDTEIIEGRPSDTTLTRKKDRFVLDRGPNPPSGTVRVVTEYDIRAYGKHSPMTEELNHFFESHHGIQDKWAEETGVPGYDRKEAPGILLRDRRGGSPHQTVTARQNARRGDRIKRTYVQEQELMIEDLEKAEVPPEYRSRCIAENDRYYGDLYKKALKNGYTTKDLQEWFGTWKPK